MNKTLGIDLGSNSLGWAILDDITCDVIDKGVVVFPEGVDLDAGSSLDTPAAARRAARMGRRMKFRRKMRKWHLLKLLIAAKMCPLTVEELAAWQKHGHYPIANRAFLDWLKATDASNPYCDRDAASRGKVPPFVLGRALYHLCQRRGFKSSRKDEAALIDEETGEKKKEDKSTGAVKTDIAALSNEIQAAGCATLGQYFYKRLRDEKGALAKTRIRCRYTGRLEHYEVEFAVIMDAQGYARDDDFRKKLHAAIFMQRPLRSQKHLVGNCPLEPRNPRAQIGHPAFEEFRMLAFVNNLSLEDENGEWKDDDGNFKYPLTSADREAICKELAHVKKPTFKSLKKLFRKDPRFAEQGLSFHYYDEADAIPSCPTRQRIAEAFGAIPYDEQMVFDALTFFDDTEKLAHWFRAHFPALDEKAIGKLMVIHPKEGNAQYSLKAINRMLPFLRRGFELSHARFCAKLPDVVPNYADKAETVLLHIEETYRKHRDEKAKRAMLPERQRKNLPRLPRLYDRYAEMLLNDFGVTSEMFKKLYLRNDEAYEPETAYRDKGKTVALDRPRLPPVQLGMMRNPLVQRAMTTLRRLVNYLGEHGKLDTDDTIRIELARSVNDYATRRAWQEREKSREASRQAAAAEIAKHGKAVTEDALERYILAEEQGWVCLYTGKKIGLAELLGGNAFDVEHTIPRSLSGDDALVNKTICDATYNRQVKQGRLPKDCPNGAEIEVRLRPWREHLAELEKTCGSQKRRVSGISDPNAKSNQRVKALVTKMERDYWREKLRRFDISMDKITARGGEGLGFKRRQLVDTSIMCSHAVDLLKCLYPKTFAVNGAATAFARKAWGIQNDAVKDRSEHTHHAKDAMVIAALTPARFTAICTVLKDDGAQAARGRECDVCPPPCVGFAEKVRRAADEILVKHVLRQTTLRPSTKRNALAKAHPLGGIPGNPMVFKVLSKGDTVRGPLHKDTFYGCIMDPQSASLQKVVRKSLVGPVKAAEAILDKIVDPAIRALVTEAVARLKEHGEKFINPGDIKMPSGVPVNKVRVFMPTASNAWQLRQHVMPSQMEYKRPYYVTSAEGSNFRLAVFNDQGKFSVKPDNSLVWAQNHKKPDYVPYDKQPNFVGYIMPGAMALTYAAGHPEELHSLAQKDLVKRLYKVVKFRDDGRITLRRHVEARASVVLAKELKTIGKSGSGESKVELVTPHELLQLSPSVYNSQVLFEGIHFRMMLDGSIVFL